MVIFALYAGTAQAQEASTLERISGTWPTQQVGGHTVGERSKEHFDALLEGTIKPALATPGVRGFSQRFPWFEIDESLELAEEGLALARSMNVDYSLRFMAGRYTPERVYRAGCRFITLNQPGPYNDSTEPVTKVPVPFEADGSPNLIFEQEYEAAVAKYAAWCHDNGVYLLHLPWYGGMWDELYHSAQIMKLEGYSYEAFLEGHKRLIDIALKYAADDLILEFPFSGHGPTQEMVTQLAKHVMAQGPEAMNRFIFQANGLSPFGVWGAPDQPTEQTKNLAFETPVLRALQMIQPQDYDWEKVYDWLYQTDSTYVEVYAPSFTMEHAPQLREQVLRYAEHCRKSGGPRPSPQGGRHVVALPKPPRTPAASDGKALSAASAPAGTAVTKGGTTDIEN